MLSEEEIVAALKLVKGYMYINNEGTALYVLFPNDEVCKFTGANFNTMSDSEINKWLQDQLS